MAYPFDREARRRVALEMVLHEEPDVAALGEKRGAQAAVGEQSPAAKCGQHAYGPMRLDHGPDNTDIVGDAARILQAPGAQKLRFGNGVELIRKDASDRLAIRTVDRLEEIQPQIGEFRDREIALLRLAQTNGEIGLPARELDVAAGGQ